jgi:hypothetical protein
VGGAIAAVILYRFHFRKAFAIAAYSGIISLALAAWPYFSIGVTCGPGKVEVDPAMSTNT